MRQAIWLAGAVALSSCAPAGPPPVSAGDPCHRCERVIEQPQLAARIVDSDGRTMAFRTVSCMGRFLAGGDVDVRAILVTDYASGRPLPVGNASFVRATIDEATGEEDYVAFRGLNEARAFGSRHRSHPESWEVVRIQIAQRPL